MRTRGLLVANAGLVVAFCALLVGGRASAANWKHTALKSQQGCQINIDYLLTKSGPSSSYKPSWSFTADPCFVNVRGPGLTPQSKVRVEVMDYTFSGMPMGRNSIPQTYTLDLKPSMSPQYGLHFSGNLQDARVRQSYLDLGTGKTTPLLTGRTGYGGTWLIDQDVAVRVNNVWQKDPVNKSNNFQVRLGIQ